MKDLTDFAVLCKGATIPSAKEGLRVIPLASAPSVSAALKGIPQGTDGSLVPDNLDKNMPKNDAGVFIDNVVKIQHKSGGYCRIVAKLTNNPSSEEANAVVASAKGFVLLKLTNIEGKDTWKPIAVASLDAGIDLTQPEIYVAFTFSKTNNYQSVSFNPNAFATIEDINEINGLDGLHIAFDHASGDIKLLDGEGNVLDQANLHMDADTIIADGEEGYKYVKTDIQQDIHAEKDFMPAGKTAGADVQAEAYSVQKACFLVDVTEEQNAVTDAQNAVTDAQRAVENDPEDQSAQLALEKAQSELSRAQAALAELLSSKAVREGTSDAIVGIRVSDASGSTKTDYVIGGSYNNPKIGVSGQAFLTNGSPKEPLKEVYSPEAFVWTVGNVADLVKDGDADAGREGENVGKVRVEENGTTDYRDLTFAEQMNVNAQALGFHIGDDIPLGTNLPALITEMLKGDFDAEAYMHGDSDEEDYIDELVDAQRNNAKAELVAWNAQHPGLDHDGLSGTRISASGLDVRNGKIEIGNGVANADKDSVKRYVIETDIPEDAEVGGREDRGLQISVIDSQSSVNEGETVYTDVQKDILTINAEDYISGAPTCLALLKCSKDGDPAVVSASLTGGRITANFTADGAEADGVFNLTITDHRANNGFGSAPRIVEIIPVYKSGADAQEAVPAQRSITAIELAQDVEGKSTLSIQCSQVLDWAQSIALGGTVANAESGTTETESNGMELYLIVKVY